MMPIRFNTECLVDALISSKPYIPNKSASTFGFRPTMSVASVFEMPIIRQPLRGPLGPGTSFGGLGVGNLLPPSPKDPLVEVGGKGVFLNKNYQNLQENWKKVSKNSSDPMRNQKHGG